MDSKDKDYLILEKKVCLLQFLNLLPGKLIPIAYMGLVGDESFSLPVLTSKEALRQFLCENEINRVRVPFSAVFIFTRYKQEFLASGLLILIEDEKGRVVERLNDFKINRPWHRFLRRTLDIVGALLGCVIYFLARLFVKPKIQEESPGDIIFEQERVGRHGRRFMMKKFRSMYLDAEERKADLMVHNEVRSQHMFKIEKDPRVFPFGQEMRDRSIDEIPQFMNVLKGEMSLIGTRPPTTDEYKHYEFHHFKRSAIKPGITGLWQVSGRSDIKDFEEVVALDVKYIDEWSFLTDFRIILKTFEVVFRKVGAR